MEFISLPGLTKYEDARELQLAWVDARAKDENPDRVLFCEHEPVITRGRGLQWTGEKKEERSKPILIPLPAEISYQESERGGDLTYHGPGQLVMYPILKLDGEGFGPNHDVNAYIRKLEELVITWLRDGYQITATRKQDSSGVWIGERKIASVGIAVRKWVAYHGIAINIVNDLAPFQLFSPCGLPSDVMTRLCDFVPGLHGKQDWRTEIEASLADHIAKMANKNPEVSDHLSSGV